MEKVSMECASCNGKGCMSCDGFGEVPAKYYYLKHGEIIQEGDEVEMSAKYNDPAKWVEASEHSIGTPAPDPQFMAHRVYRRLIPA